jgi:hypothetical protein
VQSIEAFREHARKEFAAAVENAPQLAEAAE